MITCPPPASCAGGGATGAVKQHCGVASTMLILASAYVLASTMWLGARGAGAGGERILSRIPPSIAELLGYSVKLGPEDGVPEGLERLLDLIFETALGVWPQPAPLQRLEHTLELVQRGTLERGASAGQLGQLLSSLPKQYSLEEALSTLDRVCGSCQDSLPPTSEEALEQVCTIRGQLYLQGKLYERLACNEVSRSPAVQAGETSSYKDFQKIVTLGLLSRRHAVLSFALDPQQISSLTKTELLSHIYLRDFAALHSAVMLARQLLVTNPKGMGGLLGQDIKKYSAKAFECFRSYLYSSSEARLGVDVGKLRERPLNVSICALWKFGVCHPLASLSETEPMQLLLSQLDKGTRLRLLSLNALYVSHVIETLSQALLAAAPPVPVTMPSKGPGPSKGGMTALRKRQKDRTPDWAKFFRASADAYQQLQGRTYEGEAFIQFLHHLESAAQAGEAHCAAESLEGRQPTQPPPRIARSLVTACEVSCRILGHFLDAASGSWGRGETPRCCTALRQYALSVTWTGRLYASYLQICLQFGRCAAGPIKFPYVWQALPTRAAVSRDLVGFIEFLLPAEALPAATLADDAPPPVTAPPATLGWHNSQSYSNSMQAWPQCSIHPKNECDPVSGRVPSVTVLDGGSVDHVDERGDDPRMLLEDGPMQVNLDGDGQLDSWMRVVN